MPRPPSNWKDDDKPQPGRDDLPDFPGAEALKDASRGERLQKVLAEDSTAKLVTVHFYDR